MTGFKSGASDDDPLGSDDSGGGEDGGSPDITETSSSAIDAGEPENKLRQESSSAMSSDLPWIFDRSRITDGREKTVQLHLQQSTLDTQRRTKSDVEGQLGETVKKADLREAAMIVGLQQVDELTDILEEWGYGR